MAVAKKNKAKGKVVAAVAEKEKKAKGKAVAAAAEKETTAKSEVAAKKATKKGLPKDATKEAAPEAGEGKPAVAAAKQDEKKAAAPIAKRKAKAKASAESASQKAESAESAEPAQAKKGKPGRGKQRTMSKRLQEAQDAAEEGEEKGEESAAAEASDEPRGVIYLSHIPTGFFEPQMRKFFSQFGQITRLRLSRSKKNGALKGYGWVEFLEEEVASIVQKTMEGYLLFGKKLKCELVPKDKQHPALFKGCRKRMVNRQGARRSQFKQTYNNRPTAEVEGELVPRETVRQHARRGSTKKKLSDKLADLGVTFDLEAALDGCGEGDDIELNDAPKQAKGAKRQAADAAAGAKAKKQKKKKQA